MIILSDSNLFRKRTRSAETGSEWPAIGLDKARVYITPIVYAIDTKKTMKIGSLIDLVGRKGSETCIATSTATCYLRKDRYVAICEDEINS
jgi:hypothetical protein